MIKEQRSQSTLNKIVECKQIYNPLLLFSNRKKDHGKCFVTRFSLNCGSTP